MSEERDTGRSRGRRTARRTRAVRAFFSARPAALRTNTGLASLASSDASVCMYPGCVRTGAGVNGRQEGMGKGKGFAENGDVHSSPGMPALVFVWHFHA